MKLLFVFLLTSILLPAQTRQDGFIPFRCDAAKTCRRPTADRLCLRQVNDLGISGAAKPFVECCG